MTVFQGNKQAVTRPEMPALSVTVTDDVSTTPAIDLRGFSAFALRSPASAVSSLTVYGSTTAGGTYTAIQIDASDLTVALSGAKWNNPNALVFAFSHVKLVGNAGGVIEIVGKG